MAQNVEEFVLESVTGEGVSLTSSLADRRAAVVAFWSGVCSHCQRYDDYFNGFAARQPEVALLVVACREGEDRAAVLGTTTDRQLCFPVLLDADRSLAHLWQVHQTPRVFLLTPALEVVYRGAIDNFTYPEDPSHQPYLETAISEHLASQPLSRTDTPSYGCPIESVYYQLPKPFSR